MMDLEPDLYICHMTAVGAPLLIVTGFKYNHSPLTVQGWNNKNVL